MHRIERLARAARATAGLGDRAGGAELETLQPWPWPAVELEDWRGEAGLCVHWEDGTATLLLPEGEARGEALAHELAHALYHSGLGSVLLQQGAPSAKVQRWKEEAFADRFAGALMIPDGLARSPLPDWWVAEECCVSEGLVRRRRAELAAR